MKRLGWCGGVFAALATLAGASIGAPASPAAGAEPCPSFEESVAQIQAVDRHVSNEAEEILAVNASLPRLRGAVLGAEACTAETAAAIDGQIERASAVSREADLARIERLAVCTDGVRRDIDKRFDRATSSIAMQRLSQEIERVALLTDVVTELEGSILRAINKRERLQLELGMYRDEIAAGC